MKAVPAHAPQFDLHQILDLAPPSSRDATTGLHPALACSQPQHVRWRVVLRWVDDSVPSGEREELFVFRSPLSLEDFLRRVATNPHRPLTGCWVQASARPRWRTVPPAYVRLMARRRREDKARRGAR